jgi:hypothetical protein
MDSLFSFPVGLFHPLQHAGLSRRSPDCPSFVHNSRATSLQTHRRASSMAVTKSARPLAYFTKCLMSFSFSIMTLSSKSVSSLIV